MFSLKARGNASLYSLGIKYQDEVYLVEIRRPVRERNFPTVPSSSWASTSDFEKSEDISWRPADSRKYMSRSRGMTLHKVGNFAVITF